MPAGSIALRMFAGVREGALPIHIVSGMAAFREFQPLADCLNTAHFLTAVREVRFARQPMPVRRPSVPSDRSAFRSSQR